MSKNQSDIQKTDPLLECAICKSTWRKSELLGGVCPGCHQVDDSIVEDVAQESEEAK